MSWDGGLLPVWVWQLAEVLGSELDEIRRKYWHGVVLDRINKKLLAIPASS